MKTINRTLDNPLEKWIGYGPMSGWEFRCLKKYPGVYEKWLCAVKTPLNGFKWDVEICYPSDCKGYFMKRAV